MTNAFLKLKILRFILFVNIIKIVKYKHEILNTKIQ